MIIANFVKVSELLTTVLETGPVLEPWEDVDKMRCDAPDISDAVVENTCDGVDEILQHLR